ncbi:MAG: hypothetical protein IT369_11980 [Candidatus Latescibacteria bacterium]|nr:hypothetical protein [Candidatus Latescibacterota bacterium]
MRYLLILFLGLPALQAQEYGARLGTVQRGGQVSYEPKGPGVFFDALDPALHKWYVPQELYREYRWKSWEYANYARQNYQRYVDVSLEGDYFYDLYGNYLLRGWLLYDWRQETPQPFGSTLAKTSRFSQWFNNLVVASDHQGQYHYAITVGDQIRTTLTPMTFSKPLFNGIQWDFASDKYEATLLLSRISSPSSLGGSADQRTNNTNLIGARLTSQVGDFVEVGGTLVNTHQAQTQLEGVSGDILHGQLTEAQNFATVNYVEVAIQDDSPEDREAGGAFFASDIVITNLLGEVYRGGENGFHPLVEGGIQRQGYLAADGIEQILLRYDLASAAYTGPALSEIQRIQIELVVANDYWIGVRSNRQLDAQEQVVFLPVARAPGNVDDGSNQRVVRIDYGLPTAVQIAGATVELMDLYGFDGYLEININRQYRQYPNPSTRRHHTAHEQALAWLGNLSRVQRPFFGYFEAFSVAPNYTTSIVTTDPGGLLDFGNDFERYELVDDNDDQDRWPDWRRKGWGPGDEEIFPGWDENNDFISDFNQNDNEDSPNLIPDYEESFLRFFADRPEFLYGVDMNHNTWVDRFENDTEPDYPYRRDQEGYNAYAGTFLGPQTRLSLGRSHIRQLSDQGRSRATYLLFTADQDSPRWGRWRVFQDLRRVRDDIRDDLLQWQQLPNTRGSLRQVEDPLPARNTWINTTWLGLDLQLLPKLLMQHRLKWQVYDQLDDRITLQLRGLRQRAYFLGLINKAEYRFQWRTFTLMPRWKSEFRRQAPVLAAEPARRELTQILMLISRIPFMSRSYLEGGVEYEHFRQLRDPTPPGASDSFDGLTATLQLANVSDYQGYRLTTVAGFEVKRLATGLAAPEVFSRAFITVYAGVEL